MAGNGAVRRPGSHCKGVFRDPRTREPWDVYDTLVDEVDQASDHAAIYADLEL